MLTDQQLKEAEQRARRFSGAYTGTSGTLAADSIRQIKMIRQLQQERASMIGARLCDNAETTTTETIPADWILRGEAELKREESRPLGASLLAESADMPAAERLLLDSLEVIRDRRKNYAGPKQHFARTVGMINALFAHKLRQPLTMSDWAQFMILDKLARNQGEQKTADTPIDLAGYAACLAECEAPE